MKESIKKALNAVGLLAPLKAMRDNPLTMRLAIWNAGYRLAGNPRHVPIPPTRLLKMVVYPPEISWYLISGDMAYQSIRRALDRHGINVKQFRNILDFGCGVGRILWYWTDQGFRLFGTDYNPDLIAWCRKELSSWAEFKINKIEPPLDYPDGQFDFIYANSVFTHQVEPLQIPWIKELRRVLKPGGYLYMTTQGESRFYQLDQDQIRRFKNGELVVCYSDLGGKNECGAFHPEKYVREIMAEGFEVIAFIPNGARQSDQDVFILRKK